MTDICTNVGLLLTLLMLNSLNNGPLPFFSFIDSKYKGVISHNLEEENRDGKKKKDLLGQTSCGLEDRLTRNLRKIKNLKATLIK